MEGSGTMKKETTRTGRGSSQKKQEPKRTTRRQACSCASRSTTRSSRGARKGTTQRSRTGRSGVRRKRRAVSPLRSGAAMVWLVLRHVLAGIVAVLMQLLYLIWRRRLGL